MSVKEKEQGEAIFNKEKQIKDLIEISRKKRKLEAEIQVLNEEEQKLKNNFTQEELQKIYSEFEEPKEKILIPNIEEKELAPFILETFRKFIPLNYQNENNIKDWPSKNLYFLKIGKPTNTHTKELLAKICKEVDDKITALENQGATKILLCKVPSSNKENLSNTLVDSIIDHLIQKNTRVAKKDLLVRTETVPKKAMGGDRSVENELKTTFCNDCTEKDVSFCIILDDITTSGNSLLSAFKKVQEKYPKWKILCYAIGKTTYPSIDK